MKKKRVNNDSNARRPKRHVLPRKMSTNTSGLSWREETQIQKALYASLNENKRNKSFDDESVDVFNTLSDQISMNKIHAQRKFAQGSNPSSPVPTPVKTRQSMSNSSAIDVLPVKKPKTEDFLTFLCLRGTSVLPGNMDFLSSKFKEEEQTSESRSATPSIIEKSENSSVNGYENSRSKDTSTSSDVSSVKKHVLQSPTKNAVKKSAMILPIRCTRNSTFQKQVLQKQNFSAQLVKKARTRHRSVKANAITENQDQSKLSALKQKYKAKRLKTEELAQKKANVKEKSAPAELRVTRSKSADKSRASNGNKQSSRVRKAKLKPTIIEYESSDSAAGEFNDNNFVNSDNKCDKNDKAKTKKSTDVSVVKSPPSNSSAKKATPKQKTEQPSGATEVSFEHSYNKKSVSKQAPVRRSKSFASAIMEAAGSDPLSSSSSSSNSDTDCRILRNTKQVTSFQTKSSVVLKNKKYKSAKRIEAMKKCAVARRDKQRKMLKKLKKEKREKRLQLKKEKMLKKKKKAEKLASKGETQKIKEKESFKTVEKKAKLSLPGKSGALKLRVTDSVPSKHSVIVTKNDKDAKSSPVVKCAKNDKKSSSSDSDSSDNRPLSLIKKPQKVDIDSLIELSSSDDSLYEELMFLTKRASKELSPKVSSSISSDSHPLSLLAGPSSNIQTSTTFARRSLSIESKCTNGDETSLRKAHFVESRTKTMCDASTNTCEDDLMDGASLMSPPQHFTMMSNSPLKLLSQSDYSCMEMNEIMSNSVEPFPPISASNGKIIKAPVFYPSIEQFKDPLEFITSITPQAEKYGICTIIPPPSFNPECRVSDDMRFTSHNQHLHRLYNRWGQNVQQLAAITKHLNSQGVDLEQSPVIGGVELDLCKLYETVQSMGGLQQVIEKNKWPKVGDLLKVPQGVKVDRGGKLYDIYCKYLVSYDALSKEEKQKLEEQVKHAHDHNKNKCCATNDAVIKGKSMPLSQFQRIARNFSSAWFKSDPTPADVEANYWQIVENKKSHVVVYAADIDSSVYKTGFASGPRNSQYGKHPWNLKILTNNPTSVLRCVGPISGVTIPTLHVGMLFTTGCWYQDPHYLPWIEYLHTGSPKIWYGIPAHYNEKFKQVMKCIVPEFCQSAPLWLPSDTAMVPPSSLCDKGVSICKITQEPGQFVVVFPKAYVSTVGCSYNISESVYFALPDWLDIAPQAFSDLIESCEPATFSFDELLIGICNDTKVKTDVLKKVLPLMEKMRDNEIKQRKKLYDLGLKSCEQLPKPDWSNRKRKLDDDGEQECDTCQVLCRVSMVVNTAEECVFCLQHAVMHLQKKKNLKFCKLVSIYDEDDLTALIDKIKSQIGSVKSKQPQQAKRSNKK